MDQAILIFHADSLTGPMNQLKQSFETREEGASVILVPGRSKELAERMIKGERCDVAAFSDASVFRGEIEKIVPWHILFSTNQMVLITKRDNPLDITSIADLLRPDIRLVRVMGEKDLATDRTVKFITKAAVRAGLGSRVQQILDDTAVRAQTIPDAVEAIAKGQGDVSVVYLSSAVAASGDVQFIAFDHSVNLSESIQNAISVPVTAVCPDLARKWVRFTLSASGQDILNQAGQPSLTPPVVKGNLPEEWAGVLR